MKPATYEQVVESLANSRNITERNEDSIFAGNPITQTTASKTQVPSTFKRSRSVLMKTPPNNEKSE